MWTDDMVERDIRLSVWENGTLVVDGIDEGGIPVSLTDRRRIFDCAVSKRDREMVWRFKTKILEQETRSR